MSSLLYLGSNRATLVNHALHGYRVVELELKVQWLAGAVLSP
jgi:hypothetical protein